MYEYVYICGNEWGTLVVGGRRQVIVLPRRAWTGWLLAVGCWLLGGWGVRGWLAFHSTLAGALVGGGF
jgi:hypothetical protein